MRDSSRPWYGAMPDARAVRIAGTTVGLLGAVAMAYGLLYWFTQPHYPADTLTYYLAGARLNAGHHLYDLGPGDPWLFGPPEFPLFGPPLIAVLWRPLAALPGHFGMLLWLITMAYATMLALSLLLLGTRGWAGLLVVVLMPSLMLLVGVGNVDALVLLGTIAVWLLLGSGKDRGAGALVGLLASLKLTPAVLVVWLITSRRWHALRWALGSIAVLAGITVLGSSPDIFLRYLRVMHDGAASGRPWTIALLGLGFLAIAVLRKRQATTFAIAALLMPVGSPVAAWHSWSMLLAAVTPWIRLDGARKDLRTADLAPTAVDPGVGPLRHDAPGD